MNECAESIDRKDFGDSHEELDLARWEMSKLARPGLLSRGNLSLRAVALPHE